jgi:hypothetical protein
VRTFQKEFKSVSNLTIKKLFLGHKFVKNLFLAQRSLHVLEASEIKLINADRVVLEFNSECMNHKDHLAVLVEKVGAVISCPIIFRCNPDSLVVVKELLEERIEADFLQLLGQWLSLKHIVLTHLTLALHLDWLLL